MKRHKILKIISMIKMGLGFTLIQATFTGGVIGSDSLSNSTSLMGVFLLLAGITLFYLSSSMEE